MKNLKRSETDIQVLDLTGGLPPLGFSQTLTRGEKFGSFCLLCKVPNDPKRRLGVNLFQLAFMKTKACFLLFLLEPDGISLRQGLS